MAVNASIHVSNVFTQINWAVIGTLGVCYHLWVHNTKGKGVGNEHYWNLSSVLLVCISVVSPHVQIVTGLFGYLIGSVTSFDTSPCSLTEISNLSPFISSMLSWLQDHWLSIFSHFFWAKYPYFLPCLIVAACGCALLTASVIYLKEVCLLFSASWNMIYWYQTVNCGPLTGLHPSGTSSDPVREEPASISHDLSPNGADKLPPLRTILTRPVLITISCY